MPARCFAKCALLSKTRPAQNFVLNSLKSHYNKIPPKLSSSTSCPVCFHAQLNPYAGVFEDGRRGESFTSLGNGRKKLSVDWKGNQRPQGGKIGRSLENSSTLLRPHISSKKNNGYFLPRLSASVEMKILRPEIPRNENAASSDSFRDNGRLANNCY